MGDLCMTEEKFREIMSGYLKMPLFIGMDSGDLDDIFSLVWDLIAAEADAIKEKEPYATRTIDRLESALFDISCMKSDFCDAFDEVMGE